MWRTSVSGSFSKHEAHSRPKMKVQGLWMQSIGLILYVADVYLAHDSSMTVEAVGPKDTN